MPDHSCQRLREVALTKPIIVIKAGRTAAAATAAASHTGSLSGSDEVLDAAFRRVGVLRVDSISQVFDMAEVLAKQPRPSRPKISDRHQRRRPGVLATDALIENHGELAPLSPATLASLDQFLPTAWSHSNPIDILGDADANRYARTLEGHVTRPEYRRPTRDPDSTGYDRPDRDCSGAHASTRESPASRFSQAGWEVNWSIPVNASWTMQVSLHLHIPILLHKPSPTCGGRITTSRPCTKRQPCRPTAKPPSPGRDEAAGIIAAARSEGRIDSHRG